MAAALRTAYLDVMQRDLTTQLEHALRDRATVIVYGSPTRSRGRLAAALLTVEQRLGRSVRCTREHDRWVLAR